jgi:CubicO group peptidase (beta-lactamase class C family)
MSAPVDESSLKARIGEILNRWPVAGLAVAVVRGGSLETFYAHGVADVRSGQPVDMQTVFRIASVTKTITAIAIMQLQEQGLVELDAPAADYLRAYRLIPARPGFGQPTLRHLLTHTAGVRAVRSATDLLRPTLGWGVRADAPIPALAQYYRAGLRFDTEPGTKWAYSNHGFATLGQIVEDVTRTPFDRYVRDHVFDPLGMEHSDLVRSDRVRFGLATGYQLRSRGITPVTDRENVPAGAGSAYATSGDMARYLAALLGGGANEYGRVLQPGTLTSMFEPHYQPDPRIPGMGLGFFRGEANGYRTVGHDGIWLGFHSAVLLVPDQGLGIVALANTGPFSPLAATGPVVNAVLRSVLRLPEDRAPGGIPQRPERWHQLCGWYSLGPGVLTDPQPRMLGAGVEVAVRRGNLTLRGQIPLPVVRTGLALRPDGDDPDAFRVDLPGYGSGTSKVVFSRESGGQVSALHLGFQPMSFWKRPSVQNPRPWITGALTAAAIAGASRHRRRRETTRIAAGDLRP